MRTYDLIADLPVRVDEYALEGLEQHVSSDFTRRTTVIHLHGNGKGGHGEDVAWDSIDHQRALQDGPHLPLAGDWTLRSFSEHLAGLDLYPHAPQEEVARRYRNWAYESAALDLALRQEAVAPHTMLYRRVVSAFNGVWYEEPKLTPETDELLAPHRSRITWDANFHSVADLEALAFRPRMVNFKPSRIGSLEELFDAYDYTAEHGIGGYGGGMFELGPGRGQIQYLASLFHPDAPNATSPEGFHEAHPAPGLPESPLEPAPPSSGFRWG